MNKSLYTLHEQTTKRLRGETVSFVLLIAVFIAILLLTLDNALPAAHGDPFVLELSGRRPVRAARHGGGSSPLSDRPSCAER